jgi:hypothetical protein
MGGWMKDSLRGKKDSSKKNGRLERLGEVVW